MWGSSGSAATITTPSGWTNVLGGNTIVSDSIHGLFCIYHWVTSTEATNGTMAYTASTIWSGNTSGGAAGVVLRGVDTTTPIDSTGTTFNGTASTTGVLPGLTGSNLSSNSLVLSGISPGGTSTFTTPTGWTLRASVNNVTAVWAGSYNTVTQSGTNISDTNISMGSSRQYASITAAFTAAPVPPTSYGRSFFMMAQPPAGYDDITNATASIPFVTRNSSTGYLEVSGSRYKCAGINTSGTFGMAEDDTGATIYGGTLVTGNHLTTHAETDAVIAAAKRLNANVIRTFAAMTINHPLAVMPTLSAYSDDNLEPLDYALWQCGKQGIRLILPLVDNYQYFMGGKFDWCDLCGVTPDTYATQFFSNSTVKTAFKSFITFLLNHENRYTKVKYKNDPSILCWETGNELWNGSTWDFAAWTEEIASHIKVTNGAQQLVMDGKYGIYSDGSYTVDTTSLTNSHVDIVGTHGNNQFRQPREVLYQATTAKSYGKAFILGEYCWTGKFTVGSGGGAMPWQLCELLTQVQGSDVVDGLAFWSLQAEGVTHNDGWTMHLPGDNSDMTARTSQIAGMYQSFIGNVTTKTQILTTASATSNPAITRGVAFDTTMWTPRLNDLVILFGAATTVATVATTPSGWINPLGSGVGVSSDSHTLAVMYHWVTGAEEAAGTLSYSATFWTASNTGNTIGVVLRGVDMNSTLDSIASAFNSGDTTTPHVLPGLTGTDVDTGSTVLSCVAKASTGTYTVPMGWGLGYATNSQQGTYLAVRNDLTTAGVNIANTNIVPSAGDEYASVTLALRGAPALPFTEPNVTRINRPIPANASGCYVTLIGGGGGGGKGYASGATDRGGGGGGGGGAVITRTWIPLASLGSTYSVTVGTGGVTNANGTASVFTSGSITMTAGAGTAGGDGTQTTVGTAGSGGTASASGVTITSYAGSAGAVGGAVTGGTGASAADNTTGGAPGGGGGGGINASGAAYGGGGKGGDSTGATGGPAVTPNHGASQGKNGGNASSAGQAGGGGGGAGVGQLYASLAGGKGGAPGAGGGGSSATNGGTAANGGAGGAGYTLIEWV